MILKLLQGSIVAGLILFLPSVLQPGAFLRPQLWILAGLAICATLFQPAYNPFRSASQAEDRGTAVRIIWSAYTTQLLAVLEAVWFRYPRSFTWDWITTTALVFLCGGCALRAWAFFHLGGQFSWYLDRRIQSSLVTNGPFRHIRHPGYAGAFIACAATTVFLHAWVCFPVTLILLGSAFLSRIRTEEYLLEERFGDAYRKYRAKTPCMLPAIW